MPTTTRFAKNMDRGLGIFFASALFVVAFIFPAHSATFTPCSTITWRYDQTKVPQGRYGLAQDAQGAFDRITDITGLRFIRTDKPDADITIQWGDLGIKTRLGGRADTKSGVITINRDTTWATDKHAGFRLVGGYLPGRGWLLAHEISHILGVSHTDVPKQIMNPKMGTDYWGAEDLAALHYLYPKSKACNTSTATN